MNALIKLNNVYKIYSHGEEEVRALDGINLSIYPGEFTTIVGQSGSGKTTMMNILGCLNTPTKGEYFLYNQNVSKMSDNQLAEIRNKFIGFIFQGFNLIPTLTALENVELPLIYRRMPKIQRQAIAKDALCRVGLVKRLHHKPSQMSGGQQQRVAIARAIAAKPSIILADEPTGNLDSKSGNEIMSLLEGLNDEGRTVIMITHDDSIAQRAKRLVKIKDGKIF